MKPLLIVANLKSNKTLEEARNWLGEFKINSSNLKLDNKKIIVCPPFTLLQLFRELIDEHNLPIELGAQNISRFPEGPYTGEVNGAQIKDFAGYVIIGHSERRSAFGEDENVVEEKIKIALEYGLTPILCVQNKENKVPQEVSIIAYEPTFAIGTETPDDPENAEEIAKEIINKSKAKLILYGGSVTPDNVNRFTSMENISGVLVGTDSLDPLKFLEIVKNG